MHIKNYPSKADNDTHGDVTQQETRAGTVSNAGTFDFRNKRSSQPSNTTKISNPSHAKLQTTTASFIMSPQTSAYGNKDAFYNIDKKI